ncbi:MAG TPA: hypothetical protein DHU75_06860 [Rikenellaceae bacterium]|nr:hypothetical protein [Rikenellaceae bacterium]
MSIWIIMLLVMVASAIVQAGLQSRFNKYSRVPASLTGAEVARKMLAENGINDVTVTSVGGHLTDFYNPVNKTINLSENVYNTASIAAVAVAAHETGHALQHAQGYAPLKLRSAMVPVVNFCNQAVSWVLLLGVIMSEALPNLLWIGIAMFAMTTLFSLITLPVEINASRRAIEWLDTSHITDFETTPMAKDALRWAAYTYIIAALGSLATLLYYIGIANGRRD